LLYMTRGQELALGVGEFGKASTINGHP
jgi:hypothetical protein